VDDVVRSKPRMISRKVRLKVTALEPPFRQRRRMHNAPQVWLKCTKPAPRCHRRADTGAPQKKF